MQAQDHDDEWPSARERAAWPDPARASTPAEAQVALVLAEFGASVEPGPPGWEQDGIRYLVRRGFILVREEYADRAESLLSLARLRPSPREEAAGDREDGESPAIPWDGDTAYGIRWIELARGVSVFTALRALGRSTVDRRDPRRPTVPSVPRGAAAPEYLTHITDTTPRCPAEEPRYVPPGTPPDPPLAADGGAGRGVRVVVIDTGFDRAATALPWMHDVTGDPDPGVVDGLIGPYAGHGTFIAGVIRAMAPAAEVIVRAGLPASVPAPPDQPQPVQPPSGAAFEGQLCAALEESLRDNPDIISLSAGTLTEEPYSLMLLDAFHDEVLSRYKGIVIVAAAGNDGARWRFWPAASPWTVSVGALSANWRTRARFSNFGSWVDVYAPGDQLINAFAHGLYTYTEPPKTTATQTFDGLAIWSGTSFSTPVVAGLIAARMSRTGENGPDAAAALIAQAHENATPGLGAVLLPDEQP